MTKHYKPQILDSKQYLLHNLVISFMSTLVVKAWFVWSFIKLIKQVDKGTPDDHHGLPSRNVMLTILFAHCYREKMIHILRILILRQDVTIIHFSHWSKHKSNGINIVKTTILICHRFAIPDILRYFGSYSRIPSTFCRLFIILLCIIAISDILHYCTCIYDDHTNLHNLKELNCDIIWIEQMVLFNQGWIFSKLSKSNFDCHTQKKTMYRNPFEISNTNIWTWKMRKKNVTNAKDADVQSKIRHMYMYVIQFKPKQIIW